jgi:hypothetical protein
VIEPESKCPVKMLWGTFCRNVLADDKGERSVYGMLPSISMEAKAAPGKSLPDAGTMLVPLGQLYLFAVFERNDLWSEQLLDAELAATLIAAEGIDVPSGTIPVKITLTSTHTHMNFALELQNLAVPVEIARGQRFFNYEVVFRYNEEIMGTVLLPCKITLSK